MRTVDVDAFEKFKEEYSEAMMLAHYIENALKLEYVDFKGSPDVVFSINGETILYDEGSVIYKFAVFCKISVNGDDAYYIPKRIIDEIEELLNKKYSKYGKTICEITLRKGYISIDFYAGVKDSFKALDKTLDDFGGDDYVKD